MNDGEVQAFVNLHQGEGGARHLDVFLSCQHPDEGAGEGRLSSAEASRQGHEVAGTGKRRDIGGKSKDCALIFEIAPPDRFGIGCPCRPGGHAVSIPCGASRAVSFTP